MISMGYVAEPDWFEALASSSSVGGTNSFLSSGSGLPALRFLLRASIFFLITQQMRNKRTAPGSKNRDEHRDGSRNDKQRLTYGAADCNFCDIGRAQRVRTIDHNHRAVPVVERLMVSVEQFYRQ